MAKPKYLYGTLNPMGKTPCFAIPIFKKDRQLYVQSINDAGLIRSFTKIDTSEDIIDKTRRRITREVHELGLFAFWLSPSKTVIGSKKEIAKELRARYDSFSDRPFLRWEIADFLNDEQLKNRAALDTFGVLLKSNPEINTKNQYPVALRKWWKEESVYPSL